MADFESGLPPNIDVGDKQVASVTVSKSDYLGETMQQIVSGCLTKVESDMVTVVELSAVVLRKERTGINVALFL